MKLGKVEIREAGKISPDSPVILDFTKSKRINEKGDNSTGKTTTIEAFLLGLGAISGKEIYEKLLNAQTKKIDIEIPFVGKDRLSYVSKVTKSGLKLIYEGESVPSPLTKLKELLGVVGVSPMEIKNKPLKDILKWLANYSTRSIEEFESEVVRLKDVIREAVNNRADANRSLKGIKEYLNSEGYIDQDGQIKELAWKKSEKEITKVDVKEISARLEEAGKKSDKFIQNETRLKAQKDRQAQVLAQIAELQKENGLLESAIKIGDKWIADNKNVKKEYDDVKQEYDNSARKALAYNTWQEVKKKKKEMDEFETLSQRFDAAEKKALAEKRELEAEIIPDVKGVEVVLGDTVKDGKTIKEGLYIKGLTSTQVSETEWWDFVLQIWKKNKVKIVVIDNFQSLGSLGASRLEQLEKEGVYILTAEMSRETKVLEIENL